MFAQQLGKFGALDGHQVRLGGKFGVDQRRDLRPGLPEIFFGIKIKDCDGENLRSRGIEHVRATQAALVAMIEPVVNPLWVYLLLDERPGGVALVGGALVLAAIAWRTLGTAERTS